MECFKSEYISCKPIDTLDDLIAFNPDRIKKSYNVTDLNIKTEPQKKKFLVCHDMKNNYLDDKYYQGSNDSTAFEFFHWQYIDIFIYFSHHFVTIPPETWINAAHENNCLMLGTFITEWKDGKKICDEMLQSDILVDLIIDKLVQLTIFYKFDGWLINIENPINEIDRLVSFVQKLTQSLKQINPLYKVIWYDSVIKTGELKWQNELNNSNDLFFNVCDGIFINYTWKEENLKQCCTYKSRLNDIFIGVDVFGRGCLGDGGFNTNIAIDKISEFDLSVALFAPGWIYECNPVDQFINNSLKFWQSFNSSLNKRIINQLPLVTSFTHSRSDKFYLNGELVATDWSNLSLQSLMPVLDSWCFDDAFYAGNCAVISNETNLFQFNIKDLKQLFIEYVYKQEDNNSFRLVLFYNDTKTFDLIGSNETTDLKTISYSETESEWKTVRFGLVSNDLIHLQAINAVSLNQPTKLGLLRVFETINSKEQGVPICTTDQKCFNLNNETYFCLHTKWLVDSNIKYYNVFIDRKLNNDKTDLKYVGSTKSNDYKLCLKLNNIRAVKNYESNNSIKVYVQPIDDLLTGLIETTMQTVEFKLNDCQVDNVDEFSHDVIYDYELF